MNWLKRAKRNEKGDIAIEALLGLIFFILGVMAVLMFSMEEQETIICKVTTAGIHTSLEKVMIQIQSTLLPI